MVQFCKTLKALKFLFPTGEQLNIYVDTKSRDLSTVLNICGT